MALRPQDERSEFCAWGVWGDAVPPQKPAASERVSAIYARNPQGYARSLFLSKARGFASRNNLTTRHSVFEMGVSTFACLRFLRTALLTRTASRALWLHKGRHAFFANQNTEVVLLTSILVRGVFTPPRRPRVSGARSLFPTFSSQAF